MLTDPLRRLSPWPVLPLLLGFVAAFGLTAQSLPQSIGPLSDYGSVLDRHGRDEVLALIERAKTSLGIDVRILASWENPFDDVDRYASAVLQAWGLAQGKTLLAVFVKSKQDWSVSVVAGQATVSSYPGLAASLRQGVASLVSHRRVQEAMTQLFVLLDRELAPPAVRASAGASGVGKALLIALGAALGLGLVLFALRRVCPRCCRILSLGERHSSATYGRRHRVYYCRRCGYTRAKGGEG